MKNKTGIIILIVLLAIPVIWVILWKQSEFKYTNLPVYGESVFGDTVPYTVDTFTLYDQRGLPFTRDSIGDKVFVANFFFASCPDICPKMNTNVKILTEKFEMNDAVMFISHSVDPYRDTVEVLAEYAKEFGANEDQWRFLTGRKSTIYDLATKSYHLAAVQEDTNTFIHSEKLVLVDKDFRIRGYYEGRNYTDIKNLMEDIPFLIKEYKEKAKND